MFDESFQENNSDEEEKKNYSEERYHEEESDYPNVDSPRLTNEFKRDRTLVTNSNPAEDDHGYIPNEESPEIPNESSPAALKRRGSSNTSQADYEVIGDNSVRNTLQKKKSFEMKGDFDHPHRSKTEIQKFAKTDKGFSEISQQK